MAKASPAAREMSRRVLAIWDALGEPDYGRISATGARRGMRGFGGLEGGIYETWLVTGRRVGVRWEAAAEPLHTGPTYRVGKRWRYRTTASRRDLLPSAFDRLIEWLVAADVRWRAEVELERLLDLLPQHSRLVLEDQAAEDRIPTVIEDMTLAQVLYVTEMARPFVSKAYVSAVALPRSSGR